MKKVKIEILSDLSCAPFGHTVVAMKKGELAEVSPKLAIALIDDGLAQFVSPEGEEKPAPAETKKGKAATKAEPKED